MIQQTRWIDRTFDFNFPIGIFPCILERLRGTPARVEEQIRTIPPYILTRKNGDAWSIQEHIGHLFDLDELHDGRLDDYQAGMEVLRAADMTNRKTTEADHNMKPIQGILLSFRTARLHFLQRLEVFDENELSISAKHPRLQKRMRVVDMAFFVAEHDDHHLAYIANLAKTF